MSYLTLPLTPTLADLRSSHLILSHQGARRCAARRGGFLCEKKKALMATPNQVLMFLPYLTSHLTLADLRSSHLILSHQGARRCAARRGGFL